MEAMTMVVVWVVAVVVFIATTVRCFLKDNGDDYITREDHTITDFLYKKD